MNSWNMRSSSLMATMAVALVGLLTACPGEEPADDFPNFTVEIDEETSTVDVLETDTVTVEATIENEGQGFGTQDIDFALDGEIQQTESDVELEVGETETVSFDWETQQGDAGGYTAEVQSGDDSDSIDVTVDTPADVSFVVDVDDGESELEVVEGETAVIGIRVENEGADLGTQDIEADIPGTFQETYEDLELSGGEASTVRFEWDETDGAVGDHTGTAASDDDSVDFDVTVEEDVPVQEGTITGTLTGYETGDELEGVDVELIDDADDVVETSTTDENGDYEFEDVEYGDYDLELGAPGLHPDYTVEESGNDQVVSVTLDDDTLTQDLTLDWLAETDVYVDGGFIEMGFVAAEDDDITVDLPGCEEDGGDWEPVAPGDDPDDDVEVGFEPDNVCFSVEDAGLGLADGELDIEAGDVTFPTIVATVDDTDDDVHEFLDEVVVELGSVIDEVGGDVDFRDGSLDVDIDVRFEIGGTINPEGGEAKFGVDANEEDCQLTGGWGQGDLDDPGDEQDGDDYVHDPIELHLTTGESGSAEGASFDESTGVFVTVNEEAEIGRLSEGQYGEDDDGGAACGEWEDSEGDDDIDFAGFINDMLVLPADTEGDVSSEFDFLIP